MNTYMKCMWSYQKLFVKHSAHKSPMFKQKVKQTDKITFSSFNMILSQWEPIKS